jgi:hypothetical protein
MRFDNGSSEAHAPRGIVESGVDEAQWVYCAHQSTRRIVSIAAAVTQGVDAGREPAVGIKEAGGDEAQRDFDCILISLLVVSN